MIIDFYEQVGYRNPVDITKHLTVNQLSEFKENPWFLQKGNFITLNLPDDHNVIVPVPVVIESIEMTQAGTYKVFLKEV